MGPTSLGKQEAGIRKRHPVWVVGEHLLSVAGPEWTWGTDQALTIWTHRCSGCGWAIGLLAAEAVGQGSVLSVVWPLCAFMQCLRVPTMGLPGERPQAIQLCSFSGLWEGPHMAPPVMGVHPSSTAE